MSETKSLAAPKASFDRRSVVKTAAWSVPVIAAAIAAPAAAASARTATITLDGDGSTVSYAPTKTAGTVRSGKAPTGFTIHNTPGAITGNYVVTITIGRSSSSVPGIGFGINEGSVADAGSYKQNVRTITYNVPVAVAGGATQSFTFGSYSHDATNGPGGTYTMTVTIGFPSNSASASSTAGLTLA